MKIEEIERMLLEFYEGRTTEEQEEALRLFFETEQIPEYLEADRRLFLGFRSATKVFMPEGLEERLHRLIDAEADKEKRNFLFRRSKRMGKWMGGVAAGLVLCLSLGYGVRMLGGSAGTPRDTFTDPKEAFNAIQLALIEVSSNLNYGLDQLAEARSEMEQINDEIREEIQ